MLAPIILFVYNRPWHTKQTVEALLKNELASLSELYIFSDGHKTDATEEQRNKIGKVRNYIHSIEGFKSIKIIESPINNGLANSVINGVTNIINEYKKVIVLEDDIITHPFFLRYMNDALNSYIKDLRIFSIGGYCPNIKIPFWYINNSYIVHRTESWGWATWKERWEKADWGVSNYDSVRQSSKEIAMFNRGGDDMFPMLTSQLNGEIDSWAIRWDYTLFKHNAYCIRPTKSLTYNIGFDNSGTNCTTINPKDVPVLYNGQYSFEFKRNIKECPIISRRFKESQDHNATLYHRLMYSIKKRLK